MLSDLRRLYQITSILLSYGLDVLLPWSRFPFALRLGRRALFWMRNRSPTQPLGVRLRLALQHLGPVWIKFGQMLSTRRDLIPEEIIQELVLLQDRVASFSGQMARATIEQRLGGPLEQWFDDFDPHPLASASIAQVHTACLKQNGQAVVLKVIRPGITPLIRADIKLMYWFAAWLERWLPDGHRLRVVAVVGEYESTLLDELDLMREAANMIQFRHNFEQSALLYVPKVYVDYCRTGVLVSEQIKGIPVSDIVALKAHGINLQQLAERGVQLFFTQVFRDSLFHADMHPGNIFVSFAEPYQPQYIAVDYGVVGTLNREDKRYLAGNFIAFFNRDYRQVAQLHVDSGWVPAQTNIEQFEFAIRTVCEPIFQKPLAEISFGRVLLNLFNTARRFNMTVQPQLILLQKTLLYVEGLGRQLYPQLDLWTTAKPFLETWMREQVGWLGLWRTLQEKSPVWMDKLPEIPELWYANLRRQRTIEQQLTQLLQQQQKKGSHSGTLYWFGIGMTLLLSAAILWIGQIIYWPYLALAGMVAWLLSWRLMRTSIMKEKPHVKC